MATDWASVMGWRTKLDGNRGLAAIKTDLFCFFWDQQQGVKRAEKLFLIVPQTLRYLVYLLGLPLNLFFIPIKGILPCPRTRTFPTPQIRKIKLEIKVTNGF